MALWWPSAALRAVSSYHSTGWKHCDNQLRRSNCSIASTDLVACQRRGTTREHGCCSAAERDTMAGKGSRTASKGGAKVHTSAVVLIPGEEHWGAIQAIRRDHDKSYQRWMPHINLLYPFISADFFPECLAKITEALVDTDSFLVTLQSFGFFEHRVSRQ